MNVPVPNNVFRIRRYVSSRDGDTHVLATLFPGLPAVEVPYRLRGIDCPELRDPAGMAAKSFAQNLLASSLALHPAKEVVVQAHGMSFDRVVADVWVDGDLLQDRIVAAGHAGLALVEPAPMLPREMLPLTMAR